ncbi:Hypothetical_protein [Hexamita inflata]|uniref:Hypothetical_protein n=1 Tax=Hexamita inflata TaxID=28002 RepID=A0ABP1LMU3_9EUKA
MSIAWILCNGCVRSLYFVECDFRNYYFKASSKNKGRQPLVTRGHSTKIGGIPRYKSINQRYYELALLRQLYLCTICCATYAKNVIIIQFVYFNIKPKAACVTFEAQFTSLQRIFWSMYEQANNRQNYESSKTAKYKPYLNFDLTLSTQVIFVSQLKLSLCITPFAFGNRITFISFHYQLLKIATMEKAQRGTLIDILSSFGFTKPVLFYVFSKYYHSRKYKNEIDIQKYGFRRLCIVRWQRAGIYSRVGLCVECVAIICQPLYNFRFGFLFQVTHWLTQLFCSMRFQKLLLQLRKRILIAL